MEGMPIIRLEIESMRSTILHQLSSKHEQISKAVEQQVDEVIKNFDFERLISEECSKLLELEIENYFTHGDGMRTVRAALREGLEKAIGGKGN